MVEINNTTDEKIDLQLVREVAEKFCVEHGVTGELSIAFVSDDDMKEMNLQTRGKDKVTDILSFEDDDEEHFGELVIDYSQIKRQSKEFTKSIDDELVFILVHGLLHLLGYDDEVEEKRLEMIARGEEFIRKYLKKND